MCERIFDVTSGGINFDYSSNPGSSEEKKLESDYRRILSTSSFTSDGYNVETIQSGAESEVSFPEDPAGV